MGWLGSARAVARVMQTFLSHVKMERPLHTQMFELPFKAVHIQCLDGEGAPIKGAFASGVIRREGGKLFLYTCWHVVTGFNMSDLRIGNQLPNRSSLKVTLQNSEQRQPGLNVVGGSQSFVIPLYESKSLPFRPRWYQDKQDVPQADLNAIGLRVPLWHDAIKLPLPDNLIVVACDISKPSARKCSRSCVTAGSSIPSFASWL